MFSTRTLLTLLTAVCVSSSILVGKVEGKTTYEPVKGETTTYGPDRTQLPDSSYLPSLEVQLTGTLTHCSEVSSLVHLGNRLFVACFGTNTIHVYDYFSLSLIETHRVPDCVEAVQLVSNPTEAAIYLGGKRASDSAVWKYAYNSPSWTIWKIFTDQLNYPESLMVTADGQIVVAMSKAFVFYDSTGWFLRANNFSTVDSEPPLDTVLGPFNRPTLALGADSLVMFGILRDNFYDFQVSPYVVVKFGTDARFERVLDLSGRSQCTFATGTNYYFFLSSCKAAGQLSIVNWELKLVKSVEVIGDQQLRCSIRSIDFDPISCRLFIGESPNPLWGRVNSANTLSAAVKIYSVRNLGGPTNECRPWV